MSKKPRSCKLFSTEWILNKILVLGLILLSLSCVTARSKILHLIESEDGVKRVTCFAVECPIGHTVKICEKNDMEDQCVKCPENMEQPAKTSSWEIRPCIMKDYPCSEEEIEVVLANGTKLCQCKPGYCGPPSRCVYIDCTAGFTLDPATCSCRPEQTPPVTVTTLPPDSASPVMILKNDTSTSVPPVPQSSSTAPLAPVIPRPSTSGAKVSGLSVGHIIGGIVGAVVVFGIVIVCLFKRGYFDTCCQPQRSAPQVHSDPPEAPSEDRPITVVIENANYVQFGNRNTIEQGCNGNGHANGHTNGHANGHANGHTNGHANGQANGHDPQNSAANSEQDDLDDEEGDITEPLVKDREGRRLPVQEEGEALLEDGFLPSLAPLYEDSSETLPKAYMNT